MIFVRRARRSNKFALQYCTILPSSTTTTTSCSPRSGSLSRVHDSDLMPRTVRRPRLRYSTWKLGFNLTTFTAFNLIYAVYNGYLFYLMTDLDYCSKQRMFYPTLLQLTAWVRLTQKLRIILDPMISFVTDPAVSSKSGNCKEMP